MSTRDHSQSRGLVPARGPRFVQYFGPVLEALDALGGSGRPSEVKEYITRQHQELVSAEQMEVLQSGVTRLSKDVDFARFYLVKEGHIDDSQRAVWALRPGARTQLTPGEAYAIFQRVQARFRPVGPQGKPDTVGFDPECAASEAEEIDERLRGHREELLGVLKGLSPAGFERLYQYLLRQAGFSEVVVRGRSGDGGIDGEGVLSLNPLVSFKVLFQCKRYSGTVSSEVVRNFRGAMEGRAEKGIILTTGAFSQDARAEGTREGAKPIELVDGEKLVDMFEQLEIGLKPIKAFQVDDGFFEQFREKAST